MISSVDSHFTRLLGAFKLSLLGPDGVEWAMLRVTDKSVTWKGPDRSRVKAVIYRLKAECDCMREVQVFYYYRDEKMASRAFKFIIHLVPDESNLAVFMSSLSAIFCHIDSSFFGDKESPNEQLDRALDGGSDRDVIVAARQVKLKADDKLKIYDAAKARRSNLLLNFLRVQP
jgi:hypothetical protein